jgi:hypothetical protein
MSKSEERRVNALMGNNPDVNTKITPEDKGIKFTYAYIDERSMTHTMYFTDDRKTAYSADGQPLDIDVRKLKQENIVPLR